MLKKHMAACLVVTAFVAAPAFAQTSPAQSGATDRPAASGSGSTTTGSPAMQPGATGAPSSGMSTTAPAPNTMGSSSTTQGTSSSTMAQSGSMQGQFMTQIQPNQIMASDLIGTRVVSSNNESIGDINDVIVDRSGQAIAVVIGVGGFLGIGEKDVAVPFNALEFATREQVSAMNNSNNNSGNAPATTGSTAAGSATTGVAGGSAGTAGSASGAASTNAASDNQPERVILRMTKAELQAAPKFDADGNSNASTTSTGSAGMGSQSGGSAGSPGNTTTAPKQ